MSNNLNLDSVAGSNDLDLSVVLSVVDTDLGLGQLVGAVPSATFEVLPGRIDTDLGLAALVGAVPSATFEALPGRIDTDLGLSALVGAIPSATFEVLPGRIDTDLGLAALVGAVPVVDNTEKHRAPGLILGSEYDFDGTNLIIPIVGLQGLSDDEADASSGNWIEILQAIILNSNDFYRSQDALEQPRTLRTYIVTDYNARHAVLGPGIRRDALVHIFLNMCQGLAPET